MDPSSQMASVIAFYQKLERSVSSEMLRRYLGISKSFSHPLEAGSDLPVASVTSGVNGEFLRKAQRILPILRHVPGVRAVAVCNSVALGTADGDSDIDLFIVTAHGQIWTARFFCVAMLHLLGVRRHHQYIAGRFCLSFFVTEDALDFQRIALIPRDPYLAFWISSLIPIFGRPCFEKLAKANRQFVNENAGIGLCFERGLAAVPSSDSRIRSIFEFIFGKRLEAFLKRSLAPRAERKRLALADRSGTIISDSMLKFHDRDAREHFLP